MSKYTTELRYICESLAGLDESVGYNDVADVIEASRGQIFSFDYPIFDESYRGVLETKIIKHYYTREIGYETFGLWKLHLDSKMNEIMPYYNKLYKTELIEFNPLYDVDLTRDFHRTNDNENSGHSSGDFNEQTTGNDGGSVNENSNGTNWTLQQDTPQNGLQQVENMSYLSYATKETSQNTSNSINNRNYSSTSKGDNGSQFANEFNGVEDYLEHVSGTNGGASYSKKIEEFRKTLLNIDVRIIDDLKDLFIYLW